jgi:hypothetical protein
MIFTIEILHLDVHSAPDTIRLFAELFLPALLTETD